MPLHQGDRNVRVRACESNRDGDVEPPTGATRSFGIEEAQKWECIAAYCDQERAQTCTRFFSDSSVVQAGHQGTSHAPVLTALSSGMSLPSKDEP